MDIKDVLGAGEVGKEIVKQAGELVKVPVSNLADPTTRTMGERFQSIVDLIFTPIELAQIYKNHAIDKFKSSLTKKREAIPEDKRVMPPLNVVGPALEAAKYHIEDKNLREMFVDLITSSMNSDTSNLTHPSFVEIIRQLSPFDAEFLKLISNKSIRNETIRNTTVNGISYVVAELRSTRKNEYTPNLKLKLQNPTYQLQKQSLKDFGFNNDEDYNYMNLLEEAMVSYENMIRLNLIEDKVDLSDVPAHKNFQKSSYMKEFVNCAEEIISTHGDGESFKLELVYTWHFVKLTKFGITFCNTVMPESKEENGDTL